MAQAQFIQQSLFKSKGFYGGIATLVTIIGDIVINGPNMANIAALATTAFALYGRFAAKAPLGLKEIKANALDNPLTD